MMQVFVAGATGVLGQATVRALVAADHDVVGLSRSNENDRILRELGARPRRADLFGSESLARAMEGCDVVIRAATHIPKQGAGTREEWAINARIRREGTRALLDAAKLVRARRYVQESVVWLARPPDGAPFDEGSPPHPDDLTRSALDAEQLAARSGIPSATLRFGWFYGASSAHTRDFAAMLRARKLPVLGRGDARLSYIHTDDAGRAMAAAVASDATGIFHVIDDAPLPVADFFDTFAAALDAPPPRRVPVWLGRLTAGALVTRMLTTPMITSNERFVKATGWRPRYPTIHEGLAEVATALRDGR